MPPAKPVLAASDHPSFRAPYAPADEGLAVALLAGETLAAACQAIARSLSPRVFDAAGNAAIRRLTSIGPKRETHHGYHYAPFGRRRTRGRAGIEHDRSGSGPGGLGHDHLQQRPQTPASLRQCGCVRRGGRHVRHHRGSGCRRPLRRQLLLLWLRRRSVLRALWLIWRGPRLPPRASPAARPPPPPPTP